MIFVLQIIFQFIQNGVLSKMKNVFVVQSASFVIYVQNILGVYILS